MKKIILAFAIVFTLFGCMPSDNGAIEKNTEYLKTITLEGCEYYEYNNGYNEYKVYSLTHKGNCKNPIHQCKCK